MQSKIILELGAGIQEMQIEQVLTGLRLMPFMAVRLRDLAAQGDVIASEVLRRYAEEQEQQL